MAFPKADAEKELNPGLNKDFQVDPISSDVATAKEQQELEAAKRLRDQAKDEKLQSLKKTIIVSGIIVAVAGAVFAITKKLREK